MKKSLIRMLLVSTSLLAVAQVAYAEEADTDAFQLGASTIVGHCKKVGDVGLGQTGER